MVVKKLKLRRTKAHKQKHVTLHHHHSKPFRKRHVSLLTVSIVGLVVVLAGLIQYRDQVIAGVVSSRNFIADLVTSDKNYVISVESSYGFGLDFDSQELFANAVDGKTGKLYQGSELLQKRAYSKLQLTPLSQQNVSDQSVISISYYPEISGVLSSEALLDLVFKGGSIKRDDVQFLSSEPVDISGNTFEKSVWRSKRSLGPINNLFVSFSVYTANINGHPLVITVNEGFVDVPGMHPQYQNLLQSINFSPQTVEVHNQKVSTAGPSILDTLLMSKVAAAAEAEPAANDASKRIAALYSPAVSRVYNMYCMDISFDDKPVIKDACMGGSGSGFFISKDGYMATNGHVIAASAKDIAIYDAFTYALYGDGALMTLLAEAAQLKPSDIPSGATDQEAYAAIANKLYEIEDSRFKKTNDIQNLLVSLGNAKPDIEKLVADTQARTKYEPDQSIKHATIKAVDFRLVDGLDGFKASDVAIIKVEGSNFPTVRLGSIDDVVQGESLAILGYPGNANENGLVDSEESTATLTTGKVSKKTTASGSDKKLIETETTIGHGNSGGPAFGERETVVGIATYTADGAGSGDGTYNYIRDIKDLTDLATKELVAFDTNSETQKEWEAGMELFYTARYSKALVNFEKVKSLYPSHSKVEEFIATANQRIANGEDVKDFPVELAIAGAAILLVGVGAGTFMIVHHHKKHKVYKSGVAQGTVSPFERGVPADPQHVRVDHAVTPHDPNAIAPAPSAPLAPSTPPVEPVAPVTPEPAAPTNDEQKPPTV